MGNFSYKNGALHAEGVNLTALAERHGTPAYVYSRAAIEANWRAYADACAGRDALVCYSVKANGNLAILNLLARLGSGFDIVSGGELERVIAAGGEPGKVVFSGTGKRADEMARALEAGIHCFNVESEAELLRLDEIAGQMSLTAPVSIRVNPDIDPDTHPYIATGLRGNKFGVDHEEALEIYRLADRLGHITATGIDCHIGSQITSTGPYVDAVKKLLALLGHLEKTGISVSHIDIGGGLGISYRDETAPDAAGFAGVISDLVPARYGIILEPGRSIVGNAGVLLTRVEYLKANREKHFAVVDASMNDLLRPSLYQAWHDIIPVSERADGAQAEYDVVGPICETGDFLGLGRSLSLGPDDLLAVMCAGAYGFSMSSNYNARPRAVELLVDGERGHVIRERETVGQLMAGEKILPA
ncbi:MAG: diaminopimelate decarboxylase [Gammaproteobacteria bacterium]|nr:diaminopimelate decarboxylase [Gammaproteobacteria bacterium]